MSDESHAFFVNTPWTWRERLRFKIFPSGHCDVPSDKAYADCIVSTTRVYLSWPDRFRVLISGKLEVVSKTSTQNEVGYCDTNSVAYPVLTH